MAKSPPSSRFNVAFCQVVRRLRERRGMTQVQMAMALDTNAENYKKYEGRTPLPHRFIPAFCAIIGIEVNELFNMVAAEAAGSGGQKSAA